MQSPFLELFVRLSGLDLESLSIILLLRADMEKFHASEELTSPIQVVCNYLDKLRLNQLDRENLVFSAHAPNVHYLAS